MLRPVRWSRRPGWSSTPTGLSCAPA